jgi:hypothetical protein
MLTQTKTLYAFEAEVFEDLDNLSLCLEEPTPDADNPVFPVGKAGEPDDGKICYPATVARWADGYGMWYQAEDRRGGRRRCFASSPDGFAWERRGVAGEGLFNVIGNSFNVYNDDGRYLAPFTSLGIDAAIDAAFPALRPKDIPDARRRNIAEKAIARSGRRGVPTFVGVATSDDGLHWSLAEPTPRLPMMLETPRICRFQGRYLMNAQTHGNWLDPPQRGCRAVAFFASDDLLRWEVLPHRMTNTAHEAIDGQTHVGIVPIKCIDGRLLIGLGGRFDDGPELPDQHFDVTLLYSTDGLDWKPVAPAHERRSWIRRGRRGDWDFGGTVGMGMVERGDEAAVYYSGTGIGNGSHSYPSYDPGPCQVGRVRFVRDRFAALQPTVGWNAIFANAQAAGARGAATTRPVPLSSDRPVALNVEIPAGCGAEVAVDVLSCDGAPIETASVTEGGVSTRVPLRQPPPSEPVRLRVTLTGGAAPDRVPRLFAIHY